MTPQDDHWVRFLCYVRQTLYEDAGLAAAGIVAVPSTYADPALTLWARDLVRQVGSHLLSFSVAREVYTRIARATAAHDVGWAYVHSSRCPEEKQGVVLRQDILDEAQMYAEALAKLGDLGR